MEELRARLAEWRAQGHLSIDQEEAIARSEGAADVMATDRRMLEALTYIGAVLFLIGSLIVAFDVGLPDDILFDGGDSNSWGLFLLSLAAAIALGLAAWMISERSSDPATDRGVGLTALAAWVAFLVAEVVLVVDLVDFGQASTLMVGLAALAIALPIYLWRPGAPAQLALAIASVVTIVGVLVILFDSEDVFGVAFGSSSDTTFFLVGGLLFTAFGLGWLHLADRGHLVPRNLGYVLGGWVALVGAAFFPNIAQGWVVVMLGIGIFLTLTGVWKSRTLLMAIGTVFIVYGLAGLLDLLFEDSILSAGIVMLLAGAAALAAVIVRSDTVAASAMRMPEADVTTPPSLPDLEPDLPADPPTESQPPEPPTAG
ncbi:MAG: hypothetical protein OES13_04510 [Acidimicrobiia bacterium]|nr:hypothetical protein [Acidimicrobiia bacterium]